MNEGGEIQVVAADDVSGLVNELQVGGQQGVAPQLYLVKVGQGNAQHRQGREQVGDPAAAGEKVKKPDQQHRGHQVQPQQRRGLEIVVHQSLAGQGGVGLGRQGQGQPAQENAQPGQADGKPEMVPEQVFWVTSLGQTDDAIEMGQTDPSEPLSKINVKCTSSISHFLPKKKGWCGKVAHFPPTFPHLLFSEKKVGALS